MNVQPIYLNTTPCVDVINSELYQKSYILLESIKGVDNAKAILADLGDFLPQYTGTLEHEVKYKPGFEKVAYSKSTNQICVHTEAPGWSPTPRLLALYCYHQARCGGGYTDLLHINTLLPLLSLTQRNIMAKTSLHFPSPNGGVTCTMLSTHNERLMLRFSYNLLTSGSYEASATQAIPIEHLPLKYQGIHLAHEINAIFLKQHQPILIPDDGLLIWDNQSVLHARNQYKDKNRHLIRYWIA